MNESFLKRRSHMNESLSKRSNNMKRKLILTMVQSCMAMGLLAAPVYAANNSADGGLWQVQAGVGMGYDSNAYHAPKTPYQDLAQGVQVVPNVQSGWFAPITLGAEYKEPTGMAFKYNFAGDVYLNSALQNANSYDNTAKLGWNSVLDSGSEGSVLYAGFLAGYHKNIYVDHDTGLAKVTRASGTDISNRYTHFDIGGEVKIKYLSNDVEYKLSSQLVSLMYSDPVVVATMDHVLFGFGGSARFPLGDNATKLKVGYDFAMRNYTNRPARNAQGVQSRANPMLRYYYHTLSGQLYQKFSRNFMAFLDLERTYRVDNFAKYNSYTKDKVKLRVLYRLSHDSKIRGSVAYSQRKYPNAFAFDVPAGGSKDYKKLNVSLKGEVATLFSSLGDPVLWSKVNYMKQTTTDLRYQYNQTEASVGAEWAF